MEGLPHNRVFADDRRLATLVVLAGRTAREIVRLRPTSHSYRFGPVLCQACTSIPMKITHQKPIVHFLRNVIKTIEILVTQRRGKKTRLSEFEKMNPGVEILPKE